MIQTRLLRKVLVAALLCLSVFTVDGRGQAPDEGASVVAGELLVEPPTLMNLGFEWFIEGDDNRNAEVDVS